MSKLKICSQNIRGLRGQTKCNKLLVEIERRKPDIMVIIDTHFNQAHHNYFKNLLRNYDLYSNLVENSSRGVSIIIKSSLDISVIDKYTDNDGNILILKLNMDNIDLVLCASYGPSNGDFPQYFDNLFDLAFRFGSENIIIVGDHNCTLNHTMDNRGYRNGQNNPNAGARMNILKDFYEMDDIYRKMHPHTLSYTWENPDINTTQKSRIDYFLTSTSVTNNAISTHNYPVTNFSDHSLIELVIDMNKVTMAPGYWKVRDYMMSHNQLAVNMDKMAYDAYGQYKVSPNDRSYLDTLSPLEKEEFYNTSFEEISNSEIRINAVDFLEILVNRATKVCQEYSASLRVIEVNQLDLIQSELKSLANHDDPLSLQRKIDLRNQYSELLSKKSIDLYIERNKEWILLGEKMNKTFFSLEKSKSSSRYIAELFLESKKVPGREPPLSKDQSLIEHEIHHYYSNLFSDTNNIDPNSSIENFLEIPNNNEYKLSEHAKNDMDRNLNIEEFDNFIKDVKKGSTPGSSGLSYQFYSKFWYIFRKAVFNCALEIERTGKMPLFLRIGIMSLLPKGKKDRRKPPNWRPLILQDVLYKMMSGVFTNRLKPHIGTIIKEDQTGFIAGQSMDENIRIISSVLEYAKRANKKGIILSIDFKSAFDFIDHKYIMNNAPRLLSQDSIRSSLDVTWSAVTRSPQPRTLSV